MLVRITEKCDMVCNHCMINAGPDGKHMEEPVYEQTLTFIKTIGYPFIMLTGGEPFMHPQLIQFIKLAQAQKIKVLILSNGTFVENDDIRNTIIDMDIPVQISNDPRYYPKKVPIFKHKNFYYEDTLRLISPFHRAVTNNLEITRQSPLCFNLRSFCRTLKDFKLAVMALRLKTKMCTPSINIDGSLAAGESNACSTFGTVYDNNLTLTNNLNQLKCKKCGLYKNLEPEYLKAIGEND